MAHKIHLIGSIPFEDAATVFSEMGRRFGEHAPRIPDGETDRSWMAWLGHAVENHPAFEQDRTEVPGRPNYGHSRYKLKPGFKGEVVFDTLRHAEVAKASYAEFKRQQDRGVLPAGAKFLFPIATPACFCSGQLHQDDQVALEPAYEAAILREIEKMLETIPAQALAIQWDAPTETWQIERGTPTRFGKTRDEMTRSAIERLVRIGNGVPQGVDLIYHFCYGDPGHKHIVEPADSSVMVDLANGIAAGIQRSVELYHFPVPRERDDDAYFVDLRRLKIAPESEICLGLVHHTGGVDATRRRMATADKFVKDYWIATECGMGRRDPKTIDELLDVHADIVGAKR
jgi:hypothetical protein